MGSLLAGISLLNPSVAQTKSLDDPEDSHLALSMLTSLSAHDESDLLFDDGGLSRHCRLD